jgi:hypothetical protein
MTLTTRERLERTARIVAGGTCPHARRLGAVPAVYCEKPVNPLTGEHIDGAVYHCGDIEARTVWWLEDDRGASIE